MSRVMYVLYFTYRPLAAELVGPSHRLWPVCARAQTRLCLVLGPIGRQSCAMAIGTGAFGR